MKSYGYLLLPIWMVCSQFFSQHSLQASDINLEAKEAQCSNRMIELNGSVTIDHELGVLKAAQVTLEPQQEGLKQPLITLKEDVTVDWWDGATLSSQYAQFNLATLTGHFEGSPKAPYIRYIRPDRAKNRAIALSGQKMDLQIKETAGSGERRGFKLETLDLDGEVALAEEGFYTIQADHATYSSLDQEQSSSAASLTRQPAQIVLTRQQLTDFCSVKTATGDCLFARYLTLNLPERVISGEAIKGELVASHRAAVKESPAASEVMQVECERLVWRVPEEILELQKEVELHHPGYGDLRCDQKVSLKRHRFEGMWQLKGIETEGVTHLLYRGDPTTTHCLTCYGVVSIHHDELFTTLHSPKNSENQVEEAKQLLFEDGYGRIYADKAKIEYDMIGLRPKPCKIILCGNVRMHNSYKQPLGSETDVQQYALADLVEFYPETRQMRFSSLDPKRRVLFFDRVNNLQMSAPRLSISRGPHQGKETIKGEGDVQFVFREQEVELFKKRFQMSPSGQGALKSHERAGK